MACLLIAADHELFPENGVVFGKKVLSSQSGFISDENKIDSDYGQKWNVALD